MSYEMNYTDDIADKSAILGMLNSTIADEYRAKVVKATRNGTYAEGIRELDQAECSAFVEWLGLTNADDIVADLVVLKSYTDEYKCPLSDLIELCIDLENENYTDDIVSLAEYNAEPVSMLVDIGDSTDDLVEISAFSDDKEGSQELSTTDEVECNSMDFEPMSDDIEQILNCECSACSSAKATFSVDKGQMSSIIEAIAEGIEQN